MDWNNSFLGKGWGFPPTFSKGGRGVESVSAEEDIRQSLLIILSTSLGERVMRPDFGCDLNDFMFEEIDQALITGIKRTISDAVLFHETRIDLENVEVNEHKDEPGLLLISLSYKLRTTNSRFNMVYPFHLNEASREV